MKQKNRFFYSEVSRIPNEFVNAGFLPIQRIYISGNEAIAQLFLDEQLLMFCNSAVGRAIDRTFLR